MLARTTHDAMIVKETRFSSELVPREVNRCNDGVIGVRKKWVVPETLDDGSAERRFVGALLGTGAARVDEPAHGKCPCPAAHKQAYRKCTRSQMSVEGPSPQTGV